MLPEPRKHINSIAPYPPGKPIEDVQREYGLDSVIKLASNENPCGPSPKAIKAMMKAASEMHLYPDGNGFYLKEALSKRFKFPTEMIILGNGSDEISDMLAVAYLGTENNLVCSQYDFISYKLAAQSMGAGCKEVPLKDWRVDVDGLLNAIDAKTKLVCIANPSNPIGTMLTKKELDHFFANVPSTTLVMLDEAYVEYVESREYCEGMKYLKKCPNLIVTRTFSKVYGLAGLRIGYGFTNPEVVKNLDRVRTPFNANRMSQLAAIAALDDGAFIKRSVETNQKGRKLLYDAFTKMGLSYVPSQTNFILVDTARPGAAVNESLLRQGVIVRPLAGYGLPQHIRITIGTPAENRRLIASLKKTLKEVAVG
jgi:histidinol-phosphate aminotransferase